MSIRVLEYEVGLDKITPNVEQFAGTQGDKTATRIDFVLTEELENLVNKEGLYYRFDGYDTEGNVIRTDSKALTEKRLSFVLPESLTRLGGRISVYLIITQTADEKTETELYVFPARLRLNALPTGSDIDKEEYESLTTLAETAKSEVNKLFGNNVFVFGGGSASDEFIWPPTTDKVYDPEENESESKKAVTSGGVFRALKGLYNKIIEQINSSIETLKRTYKDYVVEQGVTEDGWTYIKWESGFAECWGKFHSTSKAYEELAKIDVNLPIVFVEEPTTICSGMQFKTATSYITMVSTSQTTASAFMKCGSPIGDEYPCWFNFNVKGRWK